MRPSAGRPRFTAGDRGADRERAREYATRLGTPTAKPASMTARGLGMPAAARQPSLWAGRLQTSRHLGGRFRPRFFFFFPGNASCLTSLWCYYFTEI